MLRYCLVLIGLLLALPAAAQSQDASVSEPVPYALKDTEVWDIRAGKLERTYKLYVSLPESYRDGRRRYPVVFVTDADYAFPLVRSIARRVGHRGRDLEDFILVGISYATGDTPEFSRRRDYTPTPSRLEKRSDMPGRKPIFGEAEAFRLFLNDDVFPFIAKTYRADMSRKIYAGHSYGGLFGLHVLLTEPKMFSHYIIGSPSLWFDQKVMFKREQEFADAHTDLPANLFMAIGSFETMNKAAKNLRYSRTLDMIGDLQGFEKALAGRNYPGLKLTSQIIQDEDHLTVFPAIVTRGLQWALPARRQR
ncbi:alpha/beta hydrolase-fold protein [Bosea sp. BK604]|uniref:alpha/beta hydrolase n=1 Tax=Bosea sp. BK604 TaxID=2512180 RepID=UPI00104B3AB2|nr:alpha/beta hydrolase-fold protein [Bosea sp. BK604]TCR67318.1 hypothetical protein EV560_103378 [Bosea sp. BK604]